VRLDTALSFQNRKTIRLALQVTIPFMLQSGLSPTSAFADPEKVKPHWLTRQSWNLIFATLI